VFIFGSSSFSDPDYYLRFIVRRFFAVLCGVLRGRQIVKRRAIVRTMMICLMSVFVSAALFSEKTPAQVTDPDGRKSAIFDLPRIKIPVLMSKVPSSISIVDGARHGEQVIIVWRSEVNSLVQVGQVALSEKPDGAQYPTSLDLVQPGDYYFSCWHKIRSNDSKNPMAWQRSIERLKGDASRGRYTLTCRDSARDSSPSIVAGIMVR